MFSFRVLACVAMIPYLVSAERFFFGGCGWNLDSYTGDLAFTQQGMYDMNGFGTTGYPQVYLWNPSGPDEEVTDMKFFFSLAQGLFALMFNNAGTDESVTGKATYKRDPKTVIELDAGSEGFAHEGVFSFDANGIADLYPLYISDTDLILRGCRNVAFGRQEYSSCSVWKKDIGKCRYGIRRRIFSEAEYVESINAEESITECFVPA